MNPEHCGSCGNACVAGEECCRGLCVDADTAFDEDRNNCGQCRRECPDADDANACGFPPLFGTNCQCNNGACAN